MNNSLDLKSSYTPEYLWVCDPDVVSMDHIFPLPKYDKSQTINANFSKPKLLPAIEFKNEGGLKTLHTVLKSLVAYDSPNILSSSPTFHKLTQTSTPDFNRTLQNFGFELESSPVVNTTHSDLVFDSFIFSNNTGVASSKSPLFGPQQSPLPLEHTGPNLKVTLPVIKAHKITAKIEDGNKRIERKIKVSKPPSNQKPQKRSKHGCWTCRIRHKSCPENKPICSQCSRLNLQCDYSTTRPEYMRNPRLQKQKLQEIRIVTDALKRDLMKNCRKQSNCTNKSA